MLTYIFGTVILLFTIRYFLTRRKYKLPPGPPGLPFFGNVFQLKGEAHKTISKWQKEYGDVFMIQMFGDVVVLNSYETIYEGLVTKANDFAGRPPQYRMEIVRNFCSDIVFQTFTKKWAFMKKLTMSTMKMYGNNLKNLEDISIDLIQDMLNDLDEEYQSKGPIEVDAILHRCTTGIITSILYGTKLKKEEVQNLLRTTDEGRSVMAPTGVNVALDLWPWLRFIPLRSVYKKITELRDRNQTWFDRERLAAKKRYEPGHPKCLLDGLFEYQKNSAEKQMEFELTDDDIHGISTNMIFAGTATTSVTLNALVALWVNLPWLQDNMAKEVLNKIGQRTPTLKDRTQLDYIEASILEILRYTSILPLNVPHLTTVDTTVGGYEIPKGTKVFFNLWKLHHDPELWDEPWEFKPNRFLDENGIVVPPDHPNRKRVLAFGASRRVCVGESLARNRLFLMIVSLLQRFQFLPESEDKRPIHDPRDFISGFGMIPPKYKCRLAYRNMEE